jgi:hypothetical protein
MAFNLVDTEDLSLGVKRPESEFDPSPPSVTQAENAWRFTFTTPYLLIVHRTLEQH